MCSTVAVVKRRKTSIPKDFPRFQARGIMFVLWGEPKKLAEVSLWLMKLQHTAATRLMRTPTNFEYYVVQGEYSDPTADNPDKPHLQGVLIGKRGFKFSSTLIWKMFDQFGAIPQGNADALQVEKCFSVKDAIHYCTKPHTGCDCGHCTKARRCKLNWCAPIHGGQPPVGQGKKFVKLQRDLMRAPIKKTYMEDHFGLFMRYPSACKEAKDYYAEKLAIQKFQKPTFDLKHWELLLLVQCMLWDPRDRHNIIWIWSEMLHTGKTEFMKLFKYYWGLARCQAGMQSFKHQINSYDGEDLIHFNFTKAKPPSLEDLKLIEDMSDGGMQQAGMYMSPKKFVNAHIFVTANVAPPEIWTGERGRCRHVICLDPPARQEGEVPLGERAFQPCMVQGGY